MTRSEWVDQAQIERDPLTQDEFDRLTYVLANQSPLIKRLFDDAEFWRDAIRAMDPWNGCDPDFDDKFTAWVCVFCGGCATRINDRDPFHNDACPWRRAQE